MRESNPFMRMNECDFTKRVYESTIEGRGVRGRPPVKWTNRVEEYWRERAGGRGMECEEVYRAGVRERYREQGLGRGI